MHTEIGRDIKQAAEIILSGGIVAVPTETVYGLAGNALDDSAVINIFETKNRPYFDPLIVHLPSLDSAAPYVTDIPDWALMLAKHFLPGPLTLLLQKKNVISDLVTAGLPRVGIRIPQHPLFQELLRKVELPLAAPSANPFGYVSPTTAEHVADRLNGKIPYILDGGQCSVGVESTIVGEEEGNILIYRQGGIAEEDIEKVLHGLYPVMASMSGGSQPGTMSSHYAPRTVVALNIDDALRIGGSETYALVFNKHVPHIPIDKQLMLSPSGDIQEAARNIFAYMRILDNKAKAIYAELIPDHGIGRAVNDRIRRAGIHK